jgi:hypothetical protein
MEKAYYSSGIYDWLITKVIYTRHLELSGQQNEGAIVERRIGKTKTANRILMRKPLKSSHLKEK